MTDDANQNDMTKYDMETATVTSEADEYNDKTTTTKTTNKCRRGLVLFTLTILFMVGIVAAVVTLHNNNDKAVATRGTGIPTETTTDPDPDNLELDVPEAEPNVDYWKVLQVTNPQDGQDFFGYQCSIAVDNARCLVSHHTDYYYGAVGQTVQCKVQVVAENSNLHVAWFDTRLELDKLTIHGNTYSGSTFYLLDYPMAPGDVITWTVAPREGPENEKEGWRICLVEE